LLAECKDCSKRRELTVRRENDRGGHGRRWRQRVAASTVRCQARQRSLHILPAVASSLLSRRYSTVNIHVQVNIAVSNRKPTRNCCFFDTKARFVGQGCQRNALLDLTRKLYCRKDDRAMRAM